MVARINTSKNIGKALNYNEQKLKAGTAEIISATGFIKDVGKLNFYDKMNYFERLITLNDRTVTNTLHVSLNFDPSEQLSKEKLIAIADKYMQQIGFSEQPYLVYNHFDAGHPHIHIISTNIQRDGKRISMHNMGRNQSEIARKQIEKEFELIKADSKKTTEFLKPVAVNAQKVIYGKSVTKRAIASVLMVVLNNYKYTSLPELNAVLELYNISVEKGQPGTRLDRFKGLMYRVLNESGNKIGTPIKASAFYMKPTLAFLEQKFLENEPLRLPYKKKVQASINWILNKNSATLEKFSDALQKEGISLIIRRGKEGIIYGLTYVDHKTKTVFNGSDLGKPYSAKAILDSFIKHPENPEKFDLAEKVNQPSPISDENEKQIAYTQAEKLNAGKLPEIITLSSNVSNYVPHQLKKKKRKKRRRISF
jgi:hypothetical protein